MRLKSIKLAGFKSFVDPTTVNFSSNMSSVVGPNGCGKSNIIDAVRWVMGESSAKTLRGESMVDVIFNGTTHRQPVGQASIELLFDNSDGKIVGEYAAYTDISVRRQVDRDDGSQYYLNGSKCRRRDITDLFLGTGLGPRSYAIIEQGMISRLIESRPEDLRVFIEEAAGISKYKERRRETESRMRRTLENLERLTDLREELDRNLKHLQRQAQAAEKYAGLKAEEREVKAQLLALQWREYHGDTQVAKAQIDELAVRREAERAELERTSAHIERLRVELTDATDHFNDVQARYYTVGGEVTRVEQALRYEQEKRAGIEQELDNTRGSLAEASGHLSADRERLTMWREELVVLDPELQRQRAIADAAGQHLAAAEQAMNEWQSRWDDFNQQAAVPRQETEVQQSRIVYLEQVLRRLHERIQRLESDRNELGESSNLDRVEELEATIGGVDARVIDGESAIKQVSGSIVAQREHIERLRSHQDDHRSRLQQMKGQQASLEALQTAAADAGETEVLDAWLTEHSIQHCGAVFERLSVQEGWAATVEQVLGKLLTARCIDDVDQLVAQSFAEAPAGACVVGASEDTLATDNSLAAVVTGPTVLRQWLSGIFRANDLAKALVLLPTLGPDASVITPSGEWIGRGWARTRTKADASMGVIERREMLAQLTGDIAACEQQLHATEQELQQACDERLRLEETLDTAQAALKQAVREQADFSAELKTQMGAIAQDRQRRGQLEADLDESRQQFESEQAALIQARAQLADAINKMESDGLVREQLLAERDALREAFQSAREQAREARDEAHRSDVRAQNVNTQIETVASTIVRLEQQVTQLESRRRELNLLIPDSTEPDQALKEQLETLLSQRVEAEAALTDARQTASDKEHGLREQEQGKMAVENRLQLLHSDIEAQNIKQTERHIRTETLEAQLQELNKTVQVVVAALPEHASEPEWQVNVERLTAKITRLGPINLAAIDECARAAERKHYLDVQNDDLESALKTLENAIRKIDKETRARFQETFDQVNAGFSDLFPKVFGGGTASLELTGNDLLDTGVAIMARPPGKKNTTIHLLSGGEKAMTAIALVFSIFQLNPAPFCMLDEVDAPLDDANVGRFARMVKEMSDKVQFIFITHNKISMEMADQLMGVTMHEPGVSRLVTVDIEQAAQLAAS